MGWLRGDAPYVHGCGFEYGRWPNQVACTGILDYIYHCWWRCRKCGAWHPIEKLYRDGK